MSKRKSSKAARHWRKHNLLKRLDAANKPVPRIWNDPLTLEWRAKLDAGERGETK